MKRVSIIEKQNWIKLFVLSSRLTVLAFFAKLKSFSIILRQTEVILHTVKINVREDVKKNLGLFFIGARGFLKWGALIMELLLFSYTSPNKITRHCF